MGSHEVRERLMYAIKHGSPELGYGLFTKLPIMNMTILGIYTGYAAVRGPDQDTTFVNNLN
jgi:hypothetical protein